MWRTQRHIQSIPHIGGETGIIKKGCPGGGMVDAGDLKSSGDNPVRVQVPPRALYAVSPAPRNPTPCITRTLAQETSMHNTRGLFNDVLAHLDLPLRVFENRRNFSPPPLGSPCRQGEPSLSGSPHAVGETCRQGKPHLCAVPLAKRGEPAGGGAKTAFSNTLPTP
jgi:hypothetical protein